MRTREMRRQIANAAAEEQRTHKAADLLREGARLNGRTPSAGEIGQAIQFMREYIEHVPALLEATESAARDRGMQRDAQPFLQAVEDYWFEPHDVIPDPHGLFGLIDDAYLCLNVVYQMSANVQARSGYPLISLDLSQANAAARQFIGDPVGPKLDTLVTEIMGGPMVQDVLNAWYQLGARMQTFNTPDPIWGNASIDDIVNTRLGAMGIF